MSGLHQHVALKIVLLCTFLWFSDALVPILASPANETSQARSSKWMSSPKADKSHDLLPTKGQFDSNRTQSTSTEVPNELEISSTGPKNGRRRRRWMKEADLDYDESNFMRLMHRHGNQTVEDAFTMFSGRDGSGKQGNFLGDKKFCNRSAEVPYYFPLEEDQTELPSTPPGIQSTSQSPGDNGLSLEAEEASRVVKIGLIATYQAANVILGAIPEAVAAVNARPDLLPGHMLSYTAADVGTSKASEVTKIRKMTQMKENGVQAFISVDTECYSDAVAASAWNLPIITSSCADEQVTDKSVYSTFSRTLSPSNKISKSVVALLLEFKWDKVFLVVDHQPEFVQIAEAIESLSIASGVRIIGREDFSDYRRYPSAEIENIIWNTLHRTRIYIFIGEHLALVDFMRYFYKTEYLSSGDYMVVSIDDAVYDPDGPKDQYMIVEYLDPFGGVGNISENLMAPFAYLLKVTPTHTVNDNYSLIAKEMKEKAHQSPFCVPYHEIISQSWWMPLTAALAYDSVLLYAKAATEVLADGGDIRNGTQIMDKILGTWYDSVLGFQVKMDENGDAEGNYTVIALLNDPDAPLGKSMQPVGHFLYNYSTSIRSKRSVRNRDAELEQLEAAREAVKSSLPEFKYLNPAVAIIWPKGEPPVAEPKCGFNGEKCPVLNWRLMLVGCFSSFVILVGFALILRHYHYEHKLACLLWKIDAKDLIILVASDEDDFLDTKSLFMEEEEVGCDTKPSTGQNLTTGPNITGGHVNAACQEGSSVPATTHNPPSPTRSTDSSLFLLEPDFARSTNNNQSKGSRPSAGPVGVNSGTVPGRYRGELVAIKPVQRKTVDLTRKVRKELQLMRELRHDNIVSFLGACVDPGNVCTVTAYCARGSLADILQERSLVLDNMFKASLVFDLIKGMIYLHGSPICSHGDLKSSNCVVDSRWVLQLTDFGLHEFKGSNAQEMNDKPARQLLWRAPEILRTAKSPAVRHRSTVTAPTICTEERNSTAPQDNHLLLGSSASTSMTFSLGPPAVAGNGAIVGRESPGVTSAVVAKEPDVVMLTRGTQKGDIYSFGVILYEIIGRIGPYGDVFDSDASAEEIISGVMANPMETNGKLTRPPFDQLPAETPTYIKDCMNDCWAEDPETRPDFRTIRMKLKQMQEGMKPNIFDNMLAIMEKYASNLEDLVKERTEALMEEKRITEMLLLRMLPKSVADALKRGDQVEAESFDCVTIYFSDIVGFTELSASSTPLQVVDLLNDLYTLCDSIIGSYNVYKVETIGDAYMVVSGLPNRNGDNHAAEIASMALHLLNEIKCFEIRHRPGERLKLRIGVHSGPCCAGVVGLKMPRYCLFGDTVNTASRMESTGLPLKIHVSSSTKAILDKLGGYLCDGRGPIPIKGKGEMHTYWLMGEEPWVSRRITAAISRRSMSLRLPNSRSIHGSHMSAVHGNLHQNASHRGASENTNSLLPHHHSPQLGGKVLGHEFERSSMRPRKLGSSAANIGFRFSRLPSMPTATSRSFYERRGSPCGESKAWLTPPQKHELFMSEDLLKSSCPGGSAPSSSSPLGPASPPVNLEPNDALESPHGGHHESMLAPPRSAGFTAVNPRGNRAPKLPRQTSLGTYGSESTLHGDSLPNVRPHHPQHFLFVDSDQQQHHSKQHSNFLSIQKIAEEENEPETPEVFPTTAEVESSEQLKWPNRSSVDEEEKSGQNGGDDERRKLPEPLIPETMVSSPSPMAKHRNSMGMVPTNSTGMSRYKPSRQPFISKTRPRTLSTPTLDEEGNVSTGEVVLDMQVFRASHSTGLPATAECSSDEVDDVKKNMVTSMAPQHARRDASS